MKTSVSGGHMKLFFNEHWFIWYVSDRHNRTNITDTHVLTTDLSACFESSCNALVDDLFSLNAFYVEVTELQSMDAFTPPAYSPPHENTTHKENTIT